MQGSARAEKCTQIIQGFYGAPPSEHQTWQRQRRVLEGTLPRKYGTGVDRPMTQRSVTRDHVPRSYTLECAHVHLQSRDPKIVAPFLIKHLKADIEAHRRMAEAPHCVGEQGNLPLIRRVNQITATHLSVVLQGVEAAARGEPWVTLDELMKDDE